MKYILQNAQMLSVGLLSLLFAGSGLAQVLEEKQKLLASDGVLGDHFGHSVAVDGDTIVVGARGDIPSATGKAYVFIHSSGDWTEQQILIANDAEPGDEFGISVAVDGDTAVIGAYSDDDNGASSGSAYVFTRNAGEWSQQRKLTASDPAAGEVFGVSVAVEGGTILVGAFRNDDHGSVYVFTYSAGDWIEQQILNASDAEAGDWFGYSLDMDLDTAVIGARYDDDDGMSSGSAYVFTRNAGTWAENKKLTASDARPDDQFGMAVAVDGDTVVVGSYRVESVGLAPAYVFTDSAGAWSEQQILNASDGLAAAKFAHSLDLDGDAAVIGAYQNSDDGVASGSAYLFTRSSTGWTEQQKLTASDAEPGDQFGFSVAMDPATVVIGANLDDDNDIASGSAYVFQKRRFSLSRLICIPTCEPFGWFGCDYIVIRCYVVPFIIIFIPIIIIIGSFWFYRRRKTP